MYSIGEFSKITGLTVKTLRFYHEQGLLTPSSIDDQTGYRYYSAEKIDTARLIVRLRELEVPLDQIATILKRYDDETDLLELLEEHRASIAAKTRHYRRLKASLTLLIKQLREGRMIMSALVTSDVQEKRLEPILVAGIRMRGCYEECGKAFAQIGRRFGRHICGKPMMLHFDIDYKDEDADFEACMPVRQGISSGEIIVHALPGGSCLSLVHAGPYPELGNAYARILQFAKTHQYEFASPTREVYLKGPGMLFRGNPKKYLTEIQLVLQPNSHSQQ